MGKKLKIQKTLEELQRTPDAELSEVEIALKRAYEVDVNQAFIEPAREEPKYSARILRIMKANKEAGI